MLAVTYGDKTYHVDVQKIDSMSSQQNTALVPSPIQSTPSQSQIKTVSPTLPLQSLNLVSSLSSNNSLSATPQLQINSALATQHMTEAATEYNKADQAMKKDAVQYGPLYDTGLGGIMV